MANFFENRKFIENEFENAKFDASTGKSVQELEEHLIELQENSTLECDREELCASAYAYLLKNARLEINEHTPFSVKFDIGVEYKKTATWDVFDKIFFRRQREKVLGAYLPKEYKKMCDGQEVGLGDVFTDFWHTVPNWNFLIEQGFFGILQTAKQNMQKKKNENDERGVRFLNSVIIRYEAIIEFLERVYNYSLNFNVPKFSTAIKNLTFHAPKTLYEVMLFQILYLYFEEIGPERGRTLGNIDTIYYPFYKQELENGTPLEEIKDLFRYLFIHFTASKRFAQQPLLLGGSNLDGSDRSNDLTMLILNVYDELNIYDPKLHLRYHKNLNDEVLNKMLDMIRRGNSSLCIVSDEAVIKGYEKIGIGKEDAINYVLLGCYEPVIIGEEEPEVGVSWLNTVKPLEFMLNNGKDIMTDRLIGITENSNFNTFEEVFDAYIKELDAIIDFAIDFAGKQSKYNILINPSPIYSSSFKACLEKGRDVHEYPLKYNNMSIKCFGLGTVVDSLVAIKKFVFDKKEISLSELLTALKQNWEGYEDLRTKILNDAEKYGNGLPLPDELTVKITSHLDKKYCGKVVNDGRRLRLGLDSIDSHLSKGRDTSATPCGRKATEPVSRNLCATAGKDRQGITGYMQSVLKIDSSAFLDSAIFDFTMHPSAVDGEKGLKDFNSLVKIFFNNGGFALQGNIVNKQTLISAQENPEKYSTLQIRVCGWNEYFVKMSKRKQDYFISATEG